MVDATFLPERSERTRSESISEDRVASVTSQLVRTNSVVVSSNSHSVSNHRYRKFVESPGTTKGTLSLSSAAAATTSPIWIDQHPLKSQNHGPGNRKGSGGVGKLEKHALAGLTIAGLAATMLHTVHTFRVEQLSSITSSSNNTSHPNNPYAAGGMILKTMSYLLGAWWVDQTAATRDKQRTDMIGATGFALAFVFLVLHVFSSSVLLLRYKSTQWMFECFRSVYILILASPVIDDHFMSPVVRVKFMASGQCINLVAGLIVRWICQTLASARLGPNNNNETNDKPLDSLPTSALILLVLIVCFLFTFAQSKIANAKSMSLRTVVNPIVPQLRVKENKNAELADHHKLSSLNLVQLNHSEGGGVQYSNATRRPLELRRVIRDLGRCHSFLFWIGMEIWMEANIAVCHVFFLSGSIHGRSGWPISVARKSAAIATYLPMLLFGYVGVYKALFLTVFGMSMLSVLMVEASSPDLGLFVIFAILIATVAVHSAGFQLAMADLSLKLFHKDSMGGQLEESSLAGLLVGINALVCKPISFVAATSVERLIGHPLAFHSIALFMIIGSGVQLVLWRHYDLTPRKTAAMREELHRDAMFNSDVPP